MLSIYIYIYIICHLCTIVIIRSLVSWLLLQNHEDSPEDSPDEIGSPPLPSPHSITVPSVSWASFITSLFSEFECCQILTLL